MGERWEDWGACSATCGSGGKRKRRRYLHLTRNTTSDELPSMQEFIAKSELFERRKIDMASRRVQELAMAFIVVVSAYCLFWLLFASHRVRGELSEESSYRPAMCTAIFVYESYW